MRKYKKLEENDTIIILNGLRAIRDYFARGQSGVRTDGEARGPRATVPEGKKIHLLPSNH